MVSRQRLTWGLAAWAVLSVFSFWLQRSGVPKLSIYKETKECKDLADWPDLQLIVTCPATKGTGLWRFNKLVLPSMALFWPRQHIKLTILTDREGGQEFCNTATNLMAAAIESIPACKLIDDIDFNTEKSGWHKSQWLKFWIDNFTTSEYVGIIDSDSPFLTRVTKYDLFRNGRPIVRPLFGKTRSDGWTGWSFSPNTTFQATGFKEVFNCMSFFPIIIKLSHLKVFRHIIKTRMGPDKGFNEAFAELVPKEVEFSIMCTLMWNLFRDDYYWIINEIETGWKVPWNGQVETFEEAEITRDLVYRDPAITIHWGHKANHPGIVDMLKEGICYSFPDDNPKKPAYCSHYGNRTTEVFKWQFQFEHDLDFSNETDALESHLKRLAIIDKCPHQWSDEDLSKWSSL